MVNTKKMHMYICISRNIRVRETSGITHDDNDLVLLTHSNTLTHAIRPS